MVGDPAAATRPHSRNFISTMEEGIVGLLSSHMAWAGVSGCPGCPSVRATCFAGTRIGPQARTILSWEYNVG